MSITTLPLDPGARARALLHHLLEAGDVIGRDAAGRTLIQLEADDWLVDQLMIFDAGSEDLEGRWRRRAGRLPAHAVLRPSACQADLSRSAISRQNVTVPDRRAIRSGLDLR